MSNNEFGIRIAPFAVSADRSQTITIIGNTIRNSQVAGISLEDMTPIAIVAVSGNVIEGSANQGIRVVNGTQISITANLVYSCASEAILLAATKAGLFTEGILVSGNYAQTCLYGLRQLAGDGVTGKITAIGNSFVNITREAVELIDANYIDSDTSADFFDFSKPINIPSAHYSNTATGGSVTPPGTIWGYMPLYVGGSLKKIPLYEP